MMWIGIGEQEWLPRTEFLGSRFLDLDLDKRLYVCQRSRDTVQTINGARCCMAVMYYHDQKAREGKMIQRSILGLAEFEAASRGLPQPSGQWRQSDVSTELYPSS